jgi:adenylate kinase
VGAEVDALESLRLVLLGPPGSGKGTQAALLSERGGVPAISTGEMLREAVQRESALGRRVHEIMAAGRLVDDPTMAEVVKARLAEDDALQGWVLDGYPRTLAQAADLERILEEGDERLDAVVVIDVPEREILARTAARHREDDREEIIRERLRVYHLETEPVVEHYRDQGLLREVDGDQPIEAVTRSILSALAVEA